MRRSSRFTALTLTVVLVINLFLAVMSLVIPRVSASSSSGSSDSGVWWDSSWNYRRLVTLAENSGNVLHNYSVKVMVDTGSLASSGKMKASCGDIRIVNVLVLQEGFISKWSLNDADADF